MMDRDGNCRSLWQDGPGFSEGNESAHLTYDVAIIGGGITGVTTGLLLQLAGKSCIVFESENLCFGTTGGTTAHLNTLLDTPYPTIIKNFGKKTAILVARAAQDAISQIRDNISAFDIECGFEMTHARLFSQNEKQSRELQEIHDGCEDVGIDVQFTDKLNIDRLFDRILKVKGQAKFNPAEYVLTLAREFEKAGGVIFQHCRFSNAKEGPNIVIETSAGKFRASNLIHATHIPLGVNILHLRCVPYRSYVMAVKLKTDFYPEGLIYDMEDPYHYYRSQEINGRDYLIVGGYDHKTGHELNTENRFRDLENHVRRTFDVDEITHRWSSQYYESVDGLPYIGHYPGHENNVYVATGYGGNGMIYSQVAANILKELILNEKGPYDNIFNPSRLKPVAGFSSFTAHNADVVKEYARKLLPVGDLDQLTGLARNEAKVVKVKGEVIALYKDENGAISAVSPICPHLACTVTWNVAEQSWDCPCHGARYSVDGKVLNGPSTADLDSYRMRKDTDAGFIKAVE